MRCHGDELLTVVPPLVVRSRRVIQNVTMWWSKELLCTTKYYKVLRQYYSVALQSTTPVRLCATKYYASTTKYYSSTTTYYSSTTTYYSSTIKYYSSTTTYYSTLQQRTTESYKLPNTSVLQSTTPVPVANLHSI